MMTSLMFSLFREMRMNVREIHSRKPPLYRTRVFEEFKEAKRLILVTSDVSALGMNYPDVSLVIQVTRMSPFVLENFALYQSLLYLYLVF